MPEGRNQEKGVEIHFTVTVRKFKDSLMHKLNKPYETLISKHSDLLDEGADELIRLICGIGTPTAWDNSNAYTGVGDGTTAFDPTHTDLQGSNKTYKIQDATYPQLIANQKARFRTTFGSAEGNHAWEEFTVSNTSDGSGKNLMRILSSKGTKASGETWELTIDEEFT
jgi:hypothetical protein